MKRFATSRPVPFQVALILALLWPVSLNAEPLFSAAFLSFEVSDRPENAAVADLDRDGRLDLIVVNSGAGTISVLLGRGDGTFRPRTDFDAGASPGFIAIEDLNGDGRPDAIVVNRVRLSGTISILLGRGDGSFGPRTEFAVQSRPISVAIGDVNGDGKHDLAVVNGGSVTILLGNGDGTFEFGSVFQVSAPQSIALGDLDGDGRLDVAVTSSFLGAVLVLLGNGDGTFAMKGELPTGKRPSSVALGDLNGDGWPDLAIANQLDPDFSPTTVSVFLGKGDGTFGVRTDFLTPGSPKRVAIADFNRDGHPDLVTAGGSTVSMLLGNGDGTFQPRIDFLGLRLAPSLAIGDLNADGMLDLAVPDGGILGRVPECPSISTREVSILLGNGDGTFGDELRFDTGGSAFSLAIADLNGDGKADLATANFSSGTISVLLGDGNGNFGDRTEFDTASSPWSVATEELNGDGQADLVAANSDANTISVFLGNGDGTFRPKMEFATGSFPLTIAIGDLNGDRRPDLAVTNRFSNTVSVLLGVGDGTFEGRVDIETGIEPWAVEIEDVNGDTRADLIVANSGSNTISVLLGKGDGTFAAKTDFPTGRGPRAVAIGDINLDGWLDLAVANYHTHFGTFCLTPGNTISVLLGNGDGAFEPRTDYAAGTRPFSIAMADLDGDGLPDLAVANGPKQVSVFLGKGDGTLDPPAHFRIRASACFLAVHDLNADGRLDLALAGGGVTVLLNRGGTPSLLTVPIDIRPMACPNPMNVNARGVLPVAILGQSGFETSRIDPSSIRLQRVSPEHQRVVLENVSAASLTALGMCECSARVRDRYPDLLVKFSVQKISAVLGPVRDGETKTLNLTGTLRDGTPFRGEDCIRILAKKPQRALDDQTAAEANLWVVYPNPLPRSQTASLSYRVPEPGADVSGGIYSVAGRLVRILTRGFQTSGVQTLSWDGRDGEGVELTPGVYFIRVRVGSEVRVSRVLFVR